MFKVITRYICIQFIPTFLVGLLFFVAFLNTFYMFRMLTLIVDKGLAIGTVLKMVVNLSLSFVPMAAPLSFFFATIYVLNNLSEDSEIIAMRSFGLTKFQLLKPFLIVALPFAIGLNSLYSVMIPKATANFKNTVVMLTSVGMLSSIKSGQFFTDIPNATLFAEKVENDGDTFTNVFLNLSDKNKNEQKIIFASRGKLIKIYEDEWHAPSLRLHLTQGNIVHFNDDGEQLEKILFEEYDFPIFNSDLATKLMDKDSMKTNAELREIMEHKKNDWLKSSLDMSLSKDDLLEKKRTYYHTSNEYYSRFVTMFQIVLFVCVGFTLGIKKGRGHARQNSIRAGLVLFGYFALYFLLIGISQKGKLAPVVANFSPSIFLLVVFIKYYKDLDWAS